MPPISSINGGGLRELKVRLVEELLSIMSYVVSRRFRIIEIRLNVTQIAMILKETFSL